MIGFGRITARALIFMVLLEGALRAPELGAASDERESDRAAITKILATQQSNWNQGNVDAFLEGYWRSPDLTFSGSGGIARGGEGVLAPGKKKYPDRGGMGPVDFSGFAILFFC